MNRGRKKTLLFSLLASICFSGGIALKPVLTSAPTIGVFFGTICVLAAVFFLGKTEAK
ncbi:MULTISPECIES: hypothetical protein [Bacillaceae]|jgi:hypothetical protein|uniref:Uncharacterized protein n=1 Tax=Ectobacillus funiculus TaxID=137993 RepID=A0ABV5WPB0_9BACI|nr:hypothetical protein [Ectobacillus funiculus]